MNGEGLKLITVIQVGNKQYKDLGVASTGVIVDINVDNIRYNYFGSTTIGQSCGLPTNWGTLLCFKAGGSYSFLQVWVTSTVDRVYFRTFVSSNNAWTDWKSVVLA